jgi:hypothetical protein
LSSNSTKSISEYSYSTTIDDFRSLKFTKLDFLEIDGIKKYFENDFEITLRLALPVTLQPLQPEYMLPTNFLEGSELLQLRSNRDFKITAASPNI